MARKAVDTVQINLRLKEGLRRRVAREADRNKVSMTKQILLFIEDSLERQDRFELSQIREDMHQTWERCATAFHQLNKQGDLLRALENLVEAVPADVREHAPVKKAVAKAQTVIKMIDAEAALALRRMHTTGMEQELKK
jgi:hypothetical protein